MIITLSAIAIVECGMLIAFVIHSTKERKYLIEKLLQKENLIKPIDTSTPVPIKDKYINYEQADAILRRELGDEQYEQLVSEQEYGHIG
jgi:hypothetical protein